MVGIRTSQEIARAGNDSNLRSAPTSSVARDATNRLEDLATLYHLSDASVEAQRLAVMRRKTVNEGKPDSSSSFAAQFFDGLSKRMFPVGTFDVLVAEVGEERAIELAGLVEQRQQNDALNIIAEALKELAQAEVDRARLDNELYERKRCAEIRMMNLDQQLRSWEPPDIWQNNKLNKLNWIALVDAARVEKKLLKLGRWLSTMIPINPILIRQFIAVFNEFYPSTDDSSVDLNLSWATIIRNLEQIESKTAASS